MKIKTADLIGPTLDWAVAKCEGRREPELVNNFAIAWYTWSNTHYSTNWPHGGPIIERENLSVSYWGDKSRFGQHSKPEQWWEARHPTHRTQSRRTVGFGPAPLIAAMRCYCCAKLGEYVDIPEELCQRANS